MTTPIKGFGKAVRLAHPHSFKSFTTRLQAGDPAYVRAQDRRRKWSLIGHGIVLMAFILLSGPCARHIALGIVRPLQTLDQAGALFGAVLLTFMGAFAFTRLCQAAVRRLLGRDRYMEWPRRDVDWGEQAVVVDRDGVAIASRLARRTFTWDTMAQLREDDVFVIDRKRGGHIVIPKDPEDEDELRERLMRGITLSNPVERAPLPDATE